MDIRPRTWPRSPNNTTLSLYSSVREYRAFMEVYESNKGRYACVECDVGAESVECDTIWLYSSLFLLHLSGYHEGGGRGGGEVWLDSTERLGEGEGCGWYFEFGGMMPPCINPSAYEK
jgi:hypothetical protein